MSEGLDCSWVADGPDALMALDGEGRVRRWSVAAPRMFGYAVDEAGGRRRVTFTGQDSGPGIGAQEQVLVFEVLVQGQAARLNAVEGSGPGLRLSRKLAELLGGALHCPGARVEGSGFVFILEEP